MVACLAGLTGMVGPLNADGPGYYFTAESVQTDGLLLRNVSGRVEHSGRLEVEVGSISVDAWPEPLQSFEAECPKTDPAGGVFCPGGSWSVQVPGLLAGQSTSPVAGKVEQWVTSDDQTQVLGRLAAGGLEAGLALEVSSSTTRVLLEWNGQGMDRLRHFEFAPAQADWITRGTSDGRIEFVIDQSKQPELGFRFRIEDFAFDSPDGLYAAEALAIHGQGDLATGDDLLGDVQGEVTGGELLLEDFYRDFSDASLEFSARHALQQSHLSIDDLLLTDHSALELRGAARLDLDAVDEPVTFTISRLDLDFPLAYRRYFETVAAIFTLDGLELTGSVSWIGDWEEGVFRAGELRVNDLTIVDLKRQRFAVTGVDARMRPGDREFDSTLAWRGLLLGPVNLGAAELKLDSAPGRFALTRPLALDVLGGQLVFDRFAIELPASVLTLEQELDVVLKAEIRSMDMERLTAAMDWPSFSGEISGTIPAVSLDDGVLAVDGEIVFDVFDGTVSLSDLSVERPFGVLPSLAANIDIHDLDLEQVTGTFSFGRIGGRLDGYVHDLRMLDWKPVAFDAWLGTPERQGKSTDISRQAVNHLTKLGGGGATAALTGPIMKMFNNFSYKRLGMGCLLSNNVCEMRGISEDDSSVLIMEGAGIPKIMIRAFNRRLDFPQLVAGLTAASGDETIRVGD